MRAALMVCALVVLASVVLLAMRGGLIGLIFLIVGGAYLVKSWRKPSTNDIWISLGLALGFALTWFGFNGELHNLPGLVGKNHVVPSTEPGQRKTERQSE